jgi:pimeloyl-ACP methyl ester carboxylesterase
MTRHQPGHLAGAMVDIPRLRQHVWTNGPADGRALLLLHGNTTTGGFWRYIAERLPVDVRVIAPDLRSFGLTEPKPVDATRGLRDMADDVHFLLETLGLQQYLIDHPHDLAGLILMAPDFVRRLAQSDPSRDEPLSPPREVLLTFVEPGSNPPNVDEDLLVDELFTTAVDDDHYPGDALPSEHWPKVGPGTRGVLNSVSGTDHDTSAFGDLRDGPPITWLRGTPLEVPDVVAAEIVRSMGDA